MRGSLSEREIDTSELEKALKSCLNCAHQGQSQIVTQDGEQYAAVISMPEYQQLQYFKSLLKKAGLALLQEGQISSDIDNLQSESLHLNAGDWSNANSSNQFPPS